MTKSTTPSGASGSGRRGTRPRQSGFGAQTSDGQEERKTPVFGRKKEQQVSARTLQKLAQKVWERCCVDKSGAKTTIATPRQQEQSEEQFASDEGRQSVEGGA